MECLSDKTKDILKAVGVNSIDDLKGWSVNDIDFYLYWSLVDDDNFSASDIDNAADETFKVLQLKGQSQSEKVKHVKTPAQFMDAYYHNLRKAKKSLK